MATQTATLMWAIVMLVTNSSHGFSWGPPKHAGEDMFPGGHFANASTDAPPYEILVNQTSYHPDDVIEIKVNTKTDTKQPSGQDWFYKGLMVQVRSWNCTKHTPLGKFSVMAGETFLQTIECFNHEKSCIRQYNEGEFSTKTFYWTAPSTASGHVFVRATVVITKATFWTNVFSEVIRDPSDQTDTADLSLCPVRTDFRLPDRCPKQTGDQISAASSLQVPAVPIPLVLLLFVLMA